MDQKTIFRSYALGAALTLVALTAISQATKPEPTPSISKKPLFTESPSNSEAVYYAATKTPNLKFLN